MSAPICGGVMCHRPISTGITNAMVSASNASKKPAVPTISIMRRYHEVTGRRSIRAEIVSSLTGGAAAAVCDIFFLRPTYFLDLEGYDPRIHVVYFCPQLYKYDPDRKLVPLQGEEIGTMIAHALQGGINQRRPWYEPSEQLPEQPVIATPAKEFES